MHLATYLTFHGKCAEAMQFYAKALGGNLNQMFTFGSSPMAEKMPPDWHDKIMHASLTIGGTTLMASDGMPGQAEIPKGFAVSVSVDTPDEADRAFQSLSEGGTVTMPIQETFWAQRFGMLTDRYGTPWMVNCEKPQP